MFIILFSNFTPYPSRKYLPTIFLNFFIYRFQSLPTLKSDTENDVQKASLAVVQLREEETKLRNEILQLKVSFVAKFLLKNSNFFELLGLNLTVKLCDL